MPSTPEVRVARLRPGQLAERRAQCPVVYIPLGTIEWHGLHNPLGADGLQAEEMAVRCARLGGGVVFPTVYYGESRVGSLLETDPKYQAGVAERLGVPVELLKEDRQPFTGMEQIRHYQHHLVHILAEAAQYGFRLAVFVIGHYPLLDHAKSAVLTYNQWVYDKPWDKMNVWAFSDFTLLRGTIPHPGDHGGHWETSHLLASDPETVDMSLAAPHLQYGLFTNEPPEASTAEFGDMIYDVLARKAVTEVQKRLDNPRAYAGHGMPVD